MWAPGVKSVSRKRAASLTTLGTHAAAIARPFPPPPPPFFIRRVVRHGLRGGVVLLVEYATGPRAEHGVSHAVYSVERVATLVGGGQDLYTALQNTLSRGKPP